MTWGAFLAVTVTLRAFARQADKRYYHSRPRYGPGRVEVALRTDQHSCDGAGQTNLGNCLQFPHPTSNNGATIHFEKEEVESPWPNSSSEMHIGTRRSTTHSRATSCGSPISFSWARFWGFFECCPWPGGLRSGPASVAPSAGSPNNGPGTFVRTCRSPCPT